MATVIDMPKLSDTMTVGTLVKWLKNEGDTIEIGDLIAEVETDKATMELEAFDDGVLLKRVASMGDEVPIGGALAVIGEAGEAVDLQALGMFSPAPKESELAREEPEIETEVAAEILVPVTDGPEGVETAAAEPVISQPVQTIGRIKASPLAKRLAAKMGVDLRTIRGSGPGGRIVKADVESASKAAADQPAAASAGAPVATPAGAPAARSPIAVAGRIPLSNMRKVIARRLMDSKSQVPHYYLETEAEMGPLMKMREDLNARLSHFAPRAGGGETDRYGLYFKSHRRGSTPGTCSKCVLGWRPPPPAWSRTLGCGSGSGRRVGCSRNSPCPGQKLEADQRRTKITGRKSQGQENQTGGNDWQHIYGIDPGHVWSNRIFWNHQPAQCRYSLRGQGCQATGG